MFFKVYFCERTLFFSGRVSEVSSYVEKSGPVEGVIFETEEIRQFDPN